MQRHFFQLSIPFPRQILQLKQYWHLYCFAILGSMSTVTHSAYSEIDPEVHCDLSRLLVRKITKHIHSSKPASLNRPIVLYLAVDQQMHGFYTSVLSS